MPSESGQQPGPTLTPVGDPSVTQDSIAPEPSGKETTDTDAQQTGPHIPKARPSHSQTIDELPNIPGFLIEGILGHGGMGIVYKARQVKVDRVVALKMILGGKHSSAHDQVRFQIEAEAVARLQHPNIVQIHEIGEFHGRPFFSLEYCDGGNLSSLLKQRLPSPNESAQLLLTLARAMHYAHLRGVVHRDLKPGNVLLDSTGQPKIADFGLAKRTDSDSELTQSGAIIGTPSYMAPEQAAGKARDTGPAADVYALGATLYALLTGKPPFKGDTTAETVRMVVNDEPARPGGLRPGVPRDLETICLKCLQKEPANRYFSADDLAQDLQRFLEDRPIQARPANAAERLWRWCRRNPTRAVLAASVCLLLLGVVVASSLLAYSEHQANQETIRHNKELVIAQQATDVALKSALSGKARLAIDQGIMLCEQGDVPRGLLTFAKALSIAVEAGDSDLESAARFNIAAWERTMWRLQSIIPGPAGTYVSRAVFHPGNKLLAVALANNTVQIWDAASGSEQRVLHTLPHDRFIADLVFSADGQLLLTRTEDRTQRTKASSVHLWNVADGKQVCPPIAIETKIMAAVLSPDSKFVATGADDNTVRFWNARTGVQEGRTFQHTPPEDLLPKQKGFPVSIVAFDSAGKHMLSVCAGVVRIWDVASREPVGRELTHKNAAIMSAAFSPDGQRILTGTGGGGVHLWDVNARTETISPGKLDARVAEILFSPDGETFAVRTLQGSAHLRRADSGAPIGDAVPHPGSVFSIAFSPDGKRFLTAGNNGIVRIWDRTLEGLVPSILHHPQQTNLVSGSCAFSKDGQKVVTVGGTVRLWQAPKGLRRGSQVRHAGGAYAVAFSKDGQLVLSGGADSRAVLRSANEDGDSGRVLENGAASLAVMFSPDGEFAVTAGGGVVRFWDPKTGLLKRTIEAHEVGVNAMAFSPDNTSILTGSSDGTARLWNSATGRALGPPLQHNGSVNTVAFSHDGRLAYTAVDKQNVRLWDVATGVELNSHWSDAVNVKAVATSPDGQFVITASEDKSARIWNATTGDAVGAPFLHQDTVRDAAFSSDSRTILTGSFDKTARRWHAATGIPIGPDFKHRDRLRSVALSPDRRMAATASWDGAVNLWEAPDALEGSPEVLEERIQLSAGIKLDEYFAARPLEIQAWQQLRGRSSKKNR